MIRVALCERDRELAVRLRKLLDSFLRASGVQNLEINVARSCRNLGSAAVRLRPNFFDLAVCHVEFDGGDITPEYVVNGIKGVREASPRIHIVLVSSNPEVAACAYKAGAQFLALPFERERFTSVLGDVLKHVIPNNTRRFGVKTAQGTSNMNLNDITFVETSRKGPIIHLPFDREVVTKGSLQALHERLSGLDERFMRAGGSFIVNLDNIRNVGEGSIIFGNGEVIVLPVRARKPIQEAFESYRLRPTEEQ